MKTTGWVALALATASTPAAAQALKQRIEKAPDGTVYLTYAARDGVCGNGAGTISFDCFDGNCGRHRITTDNSDWDDDNPCPCDSGPVRLALQVAGGKVTRLRAYVGGHWKPAGSGVTDLGVVAAPEAAHYLLDLARASSGRPAEEAIFPATLADSVTVWPDLLKPARPGGAGPREGGARRRRRDARSQSGGLLAQPGSGRCRGKRFARPGRRRQRRSRRPRARGIRDRKSTRLNSSHAYI